MKRLIRLAVLVALAASAVLAQGPPAPKAQPEHQKLKYFVGEWKSEGEMKASPWGPGGKYTSTDHNQMLGDFYLVMHSDGSGPMGPIKEIAVMGYDARAKKYTYEGYTSIGEHDTSLGTISGSTWTWLSPEQEMGGKKMKGRFILKEVSPISYTYTFDSSTDGGAWTNVMEGKSTKVK
jgi:Protein of unknown function (DUF1579)